jgi:hypothetical protein
MSVFKRGLKISRGAVYDELGISDSDSSEGQSDDPKDGTDDDSSEESDTEETNVTLKNAKEKVLSFEKPGKKFKKTPKDEEAEDHAEEAVDDESGDDAEKEAAEDDDSKPVDLNNIQYPITCSLCNRVLFDIQAVNQHMVSKSHLKKEALLAKEKKEALPADKVQQLKARNAAKRQRRIDRKRKERESKGHVWGQHVKPDKSKAACGGAEASTQPSGPDRRGAQSRRPDPKAAVAKHAQHTKNPATVAKPPNPAGGAGQSRDAGPVAMPGGGGGKGSRKGGGAPEGRQRKRGPATGPEPGGKPGKRSKGAAMSVD